MGLLNLLMDFKLYDAFAIIYYLQVSNSMLLGMSIFSITMVASAIFERLERAFFSGNNNAFIFDTLKEEGKENEYKYYLGKTNSMYYMAGILSTVLGAVVAYFTSIRMLMIISVIPRFFEVILSLRLKDVKRYSNEDENVFAQVKNVVKLVMNNKILKRQIIADGISDGIGEATF